jgi:hypothetical protein
MLLAIERFVALFEALLFPKPRRENCEDEWGEDARPCQ